MEQKELEQFDEEMRTARKEDRKRRKRRKIIYTMLAWISTIVVVFVVVVAVGTFAMVSTGKKKLQNKSDKVAPNLNVEMVENVSDENNSDISDIPVPTEEPIEEIEVWEDDWLRYNGKVYDYNEDILTFLIMGIDKKTVVTETTKKANGGQSDAMFLAVVDERNKNIKIIAVNRDTMVDVYMYGYEQNGVTPVTKAQLTVQHGFGDGAHESANYTCEAVSKLFYDLPIHGYVAVNMAAIADINDAVGGVELDVLEDLTKVNKRWTKGTTVHLTGEDAYDYVHYRDVTVFESARNRLARQKQYLNIFIEKVYNAVKNDITMPVTLYKSISPYMTTDISVDEVAYLASKLISYKFESNSIYTMEGTTIMTDYEEFYPDYSALKDLMISVFYEEVDLEQFN